jgi:hypothetical protein
VWGTVILLAGVAGFRLGAAAVDLQNPAVVVVHIPDQIAFP